jgi:dynein heavy chain
MEGIQEDEWVYGITYSYDERSKKWFVKFPGKEQEDEWVPRLRLLFLAEDPSIFADRIANSVNERKRAESWIRFCFYVESIPVRAMPDIPEHIREAIIKIIPTPKKSFF